jgi:hypothetical protein
LFRILDAEHGRALFGHIEGAEQLAANRVNSESAHSLVLSGNLKQLGFAPQYRLAIIFAAKRQNLFHNDKVIV